MAEEASKDSNEVINSYVCIEGNILHCASPYIKVKHVYMLVSQVLHVRCIRQRH